MKRLLLILFTLAISMASRAQNDNSFTEVSEFGSDEVVEVEQKDFLGFMLLPGSNTLVRFYEVHLNHNGTFKYTQLTMDGFMFRAAGKERSLANPSGNNLFESYGIKDPNVVGQLWKLRYKEYPYQTKGAPEEGWSNNDVCLELPSPQQFAILKRYGIERVSDLCYGDMAFLLIKDIGDADWITKYKNSAGTNNPVSAGQTNESGESYVD